MKRIIFTLTASFLFVVAMAQTGNDILKKIDDNMSAENRVSKSSMTIHGKRSSRTIEAQSYSQGNEKAFTEYLSPASEKGTKMLKLQNQLWIYSPSTDRTIQISGHLLRQSVMGSDLSYEDMMDDRKLTEMYNATITGNETYNERNVYVLELKAKVDDVAYSTQKMWVDAERYIPLKQELFAKSGQLLKKMESSEVQKIGGRWYPMKVIYKDMLKDGKGTEFKLLELKFNENIPEYLFTKAALKK